MDPAQSPTTNRPLGTVDLADDTVTQHYGTGSLAAPHVLTNLTGAQQRSVSTIAQQPIECRRDGFKIVDKSLTRC